MPTDNKKVLYEFEIDGQPYRIFDTAISEHSHYIGRIEIQQ